jgi:hypothetical protein
MSAYQLYAILIQAISIDMNNTSDTQERSLLMFNVRNFEGQPLTSRVLTNTSHKKLSDVFSKSAPSYFYWSPFSE